MDTPPGDRITLSHGEGGRLTRRLIREQILPKLDNPQLQELGDAALLRATQHGLAMTTDSFVVSPIFFPGGDIGSLAIFGTVNDLAVAGARPRWISLSLILEEGLPLVTLNAILESAAKAAQRSGVVVVTGDTKVVPHGAADGLFLNTTGIGEYHQERPAGPTALEVGDQLIVTGPIGQHGMAVLTAREQLEFDPAPRSDSAPLADAVAALQAAHIPIRCMRDATRGGVTAVLHEWSEASQQTLGIDERCLPLTPEVRGACELLGLDPLHVACEGTMLVAVPRPDVPRALAALRSVTESRHSVVIGEVQRRGIAAVTIRRSTGEELPLDEPLGAPLPRIC
jgi:hydrogenase expression/formation protein HypE